MKETASPSELTAGRFSAVLGLSIAILFAAPLFGSGSFFHRDFALFGYPLAHFHKEAFWQGELPHWNPYNYFGMPFLAQWNTLTLYPLSLIYLLLPLPWSLNFFCLAHLFLGGLGMFFLARAWTTSALAAGGAGMAYAWSGILINSLKWPNNIAALGLMPWVVWLVRRGCSGSWRAAAVAALVGTVQMLSGAPEIIFMTWLAAGAIVVADAMGNKRLQPLLKLAAIIALVALISAAQLLPFFDLLSRSQRTAQYEEGEWALPLWGVANFFLPLFKAIRSHNDVAAQPGQFWIASYYLPLGFLVAAALCYRARKQREILCFTALALFALWMAFGRAGGLHSAITQAITFLSFMRYPVKFIVLVVFCSCIVAAFGLARLPSVSLKRWVSFVGVGLAIILPLALLQWDSPHFSIPTHAVFRAGFLATSAMLLFVASQKPEWRLRGTYAALIAIALDGATQIPVHNPVVAPHVYTATLTQQPQLESPLQRAMLLFETEQRLNHLSIEDPQQDVLTSRAMLFCNLNLLDRKPKNDGFFSLYLREAAQVHYALQQTNIDRTALMRLLNVGQVSDPDQILAWSPVTNALGFISGGQVPKFGGAPEFFGALARGDFNPQGEIILEEASRDDLSDVKPERVEVEVTDRTAHQIRARVKSSNKALLFVAESFHPGWEAVVNGSPAKVHKANHAFMAVPVPRGEAVVELKFRDKHFERGLWLSGFGLLATATLLLARPKRLANSQHSQ
ncbi:MAG TPA: YfhO family protein [Methylomirabilota bacterium]|nr:YfhO family protein [Methylomirabilota bacterium]